MKRVPKGWRQLKPGETIKPGDKCSYLGRDWVASNAYGHEAGTQDYRYIRKKRR